MVKKRFKSWGDLENFMYKKGWNRVLWDIEDMEKRASKEAGKNARTEAVRSRIVDWFNQKPVKIDVTTHRPSFVFANELSKKVRKLKSLGV
ncbi:MAG: hypothetical protein AM326_08275 [Candidatus Thorarchaeota archaeon SMTZ-45]|nr:MAG: hypothetical protein AM326_08275 [Candidatus Thorarchaeota archaeon SMTZ-45]